MELQGKTVVLTGASGGIGQAIAIALAKAGCQLLLVGRNEFALTTLQKQLGEGHKIVIADISTEPGRNLLLNACQMVGGIDIVINNAGVSEFALFEQLSESQLQAMFSTNLLAPMLLCQKLLPLLKTRKEAAIVNVGSTFGSIGYPGFSGYCASKFGLRGFTEALRRELADSSVKVCYLAPRATKTSINSRAVVEMNQTLGNAMDDPQVVVNALLRTLGKKQLKDHYIGWPEKLFVRLNSLLPKLVDNALRKQLPIIRQYAGHQHGPQQ